MRPWERVQQELKHLLMRRHLREVHFPCGAMTAQDVAVVVKKLILVLAGWQKLSSCKAVVEFEHTFAQGLGVPWAFSFGSGRMALYAILRALGIGPGEEVLLPGFTCVVVPAAVVYTEAIPRYVDIDPHTFNLDVSDLERRITPRSRVIIAQHTYGYPANMEAITDLAKRYGLYVVEDCAHVLGGSYQGKKLGTLGDAAFFSMEQTKPINAGWGGVAVTCHPWLAACLQGVYREALTPTYLESVQGAIQLVISWLLCRPSIHWLGRYLLALLYRSQLFAVSITESETQGIQPTRYPLRLPVLQAMAALCQLQRIKADNARRCATSLLYKELLQEYGWPVAPENGEVVYLRYPLLVPDRAHAIQFFRCNQIELGQWFNAPLHPAGSTHQTFAYSEGDCPNAERISKHVVNLPTHPSLTEQDVERVCNVTREYIRSQCPLSESPNSMRVLV